MKLAALALVAALLAPSVAAAAEPLNLPHPRTGEPGTWLPRELSLRALDALEGKPALEEKLRLADEELRLRVEAFELAERTASSAEASAARLRELLVVESAARSEAQLELLDARDARWTWGAVGFAAGAVATVAIFILAR